MNDLETLLKGNERILLIDDDESLVDIGKQILEELGYRVKVETSSTEALETFRANPNRFDLIITDMMMPRMSGDVLAGEMMKIRSDVSIIICTGYSTRISPEKAQSLGIKGYLYKPLNIRDLAETLRRVLDGG